MQLISSKIFWFCSIFCFNLHLYKVQHGSYDCILMLMCEMDFSFQEKLILRKLKFRLNAPTPYVFMVRFIKAAQSNMKVFNSEFKIYIHMTSYFG